MVFGSALGRKLKFDGKKQSTDAMDSIRSHNITAQTMVKKQQVARLAESIDNQTYLNMTMDSF